MTPNYQIIRNKIITVLSQFTTGTGARSLIPSTITSGKLYEAHVLACICRELTIRENFRLVLVNSSNIALKTGGGPINRTYPHIQARRKSDNSFQFEIWTDVEFMTALSE